jgi:hypothetical protein
MTTFLGRPRRRFLLRAKRTTSRARSRAARAATYIFEHWPTGMFGRLGPHDHALAAMSARINNLHSAASGECQILSGGIYRERRSRRGDDQLAALNRRATKTGARGSCRMCRITRHDISSKLPFQLGDYLRPSE